MNTPTPFSRDPQALVELHDVRFGYGERIILDGISLKVPRGKVTALMGASGGGKTTVRSMPTTCMPCAVAWACCFSLAPCSPI